MKTNKWILSGFAIVALSLTSINANAQSTVSKMSTEEVKEKSVQADAPAAEATVTNVRVMPVETTATEATVEKAPVVRTSRKARIQSVDKQATKAQKPKHTEAVE